jgi:hypothetical protein
MEKDENSVETQSGRVGLGAADRTQTDLKAMFIQQHIAPFRLQLQLTSMLHH